MDKGEQTRLVILERAAQAFSLTGYSGTSMDALTRATGLTKGGIYNHFGSKEALALEAFDFAQEQMQQRFRSFFQGRKHACDRLMAMIEYFRSIIVDPLLPGGCLILNTAIEADDTNPVLRARAQQATDAWQEYVTRTVLSGIERQQIKPHTDPTKVLTTLLATLEGAIMLCKLYGVTSYIEQAVEHLTTYVESLRADAICVSNQK
jgi:TetR/AcrR family transcriptional regulator, transcriptional repressor for nem operon